MAVNSQTNKAEPGESAARLIVQFDHHSPEFVDSFREIGKDFRERCPVAFTEAHGGFWVASSYDAVAAAARDADTYTCWKDVPHGSGPWKGTLIPDHNPVRQGFAEMDGPEHLALRQPLAPFFSPPAVEALKPDILRVTTWTVDQIVERGSADLITEIAGPIPSMLAMWTLGMPLTDWRVFSDGVHDMFDPHQDPVVRKQLNDWITEQLRDGALRRRDEPTGDMISFVANLEVDGSLVPIDEVVGNLQLLLFGGVSTTAHLLGNTLMYLSGNRDARQWLQEDISRLPNACEEFLRCFPPLIGLARTATRRCSLGTQTLEANEQIFLNWAAANEDPNVFDDPETVRLDRFPNRHTSFGLGVHRCIGSNLARTVWAVVIEEILTRLPDYEIDTEHAERNKSIGYFNGWNSLPATFTPGPRLGAELPA